MVVVTTGRKCHTLIELDTERYGITVVDGKLYRQILFILN